MIKRCIIWNKCVWIKNECFTIRESSSSTSIRTTKFCGVDARLCVCVLLVLVVALSLYIGLDVAVRNKKEKIPGINNGESAAERQRMDPKYLRIQPSAEDLNCILSTHNKTYTKSSTTCSDATSNKRCYDCEDECLTCEEMLDEYLYCNGNSVACCNKAHICNKVNYCNSGQLECFHDSLRCVCPPDKTGTRCEEDIEDALIFPRTIGCHCYANSYEFCDGEEIPYCNDYFTNTNNYCQILLEESRRCYCVNTESSDPQLQSCEEASVQPLQLTNNSAASGAVSVFKEISLSSMFILFLMGVRNVFH